MRARIGCPPNPTGHPETQTMMRRQLTPLLLVLSATALAACGKSACEELEEKKCDCHDELCEEAESQEPIEESEEVCEETLRDWDCEEEMATRGLERFNTTD